MSSPTPDRKAIEDLWRQRLNDAKLRLEFAENFTTEVEHDYQSGEISATEERDAHQDAIRADDLALAEYNRVLRIYTDLIENGKIPDEGEWLESQGRECRRQRR